MRAWFLVLLFAVLSVSAVPRYRPRRHAARHKLEEHDRSHSDLLSHLSKQERSLGVSVHTHQAHQAHQTHQTHHPHARHNHTLHSFEEPLRTDVRFMGPRHVIQALRDRCIGFVLYRCNQEQPAGFFNDMVPLITRALALIDKTSQDYGAATPGHFVGSMFRDCGDFTGRPDYHRVFARIQPILKLLWTAQKRSVYDKVDNPVKVVVVGAGPVGIVTTALLTKAGHDVTLLEQRAEKPEPEMDYPGTPTGPWKTAFERDQVLRLDRVVSTHMLWEFPRMYVSLFHDPLTSSGFNTIQFCGNPNQRDCSNLQTTRGAANVVTNIITITSATHVRINVLQHAMLQEIRALATDGLPVQVVFCAEVQDLEVDGTVKIEHSQRYCPDSDAPDYDDIPAPDLVVGAAGVGRGQNPIRRAMPIIAGELEEGAESLEQDAYWGKSAHETDKEPAYGLTFLYQGPLELPKDESDDETDFDYNEPLAAAAFRGGINKLVVCQRAFDISAQTGPICNDLSVGRELVIRGFWTYDYVDLPQARQKQWYFGIGMSKKQLLHYGIIQKAEEVNTIDLSRGDERTGRAHDFMNKVVIPELFPASRGGRNNFRPIKPITKPGQFPSLVKIEAWTASTTQVLNENGDSPQLITLEGDSRGSANYLRASGVNHALRSHIFPTPPGMLTIDAKHTLAPSLLSVANALWWHKNSADDKKAEELEYLKQVIAKREVYAAFIRDHLAKVGRQCSDYINLDDRDRDALGNRGADCSVGVTLFGEQDYVEYLAFLTKKLLLTVEDDPPQEFVDEVCQGFVAAVLLAIGLLNDVIIPETPYLVDFCSTHYRNFPRNRGAAFRNTAVNYGRGRIPPTLTSGDGHGVSEQLLGWVAQQNDEYPKGWTKLTNGNPSGLQLSDAPAVNYRTDRAVPNQDRVNLFKTGFIQGAVHSAQGDSFRGVTTRVKKTTSAGGIKAKPKPVPRQSF